MFMFRKVLVLPDVGVLSEVDLVSTERRGRRIKRGRKTCRVANLNVRP